MESEEQQLVPTRPGLTSLSHGDVLSCQETDWTSETDERRLARRKLFIAGGVAVVFMTGELIGGLAAHSLAVLSDAAHLLTDVFSIFGAAVCLWASARRPTETLSFGFHRAEMVGVLLSVASVWAVTAALVVAAAQRLADGTFEVDGRLMLVTSGCGVGANVLMVLILHQSGASHGHGHGRRHGNASVKAAFVHVLGDLVQSVGVLVAAAVIHIWPEYKMADPLCTFLFAALVVATTLPVTKDVLRILMEGTPQDVPPGAVKELLLSVGGVVDVHSLHTWSLSMTRYLLAVHVTTDVDADSQLVLTEATELLRSEFGFCSITIQVER